MSKNYMEEILKIIDIEKNKPFKIDDYCSYFILTEDGLLNEKGNKFDELFVSLLKGECEINRCLLKDKEKEYLENFLYPFKDKIIYIKKIRDNTYENNYILIRYYENIIMGKYDDMILPPFKNDKLYKNMNLFTEYTLEQLGLFVED